MAGKGLSVQHTGLFAGVIIVGCLSLAEYADGQSSTMVANRDLAQSDSAQAEETEPNPQLAIAQPTRLEWQPAEDFGDSAIEIADYEPVVAARDGDSSPAAASAGPSGDDPTGQPIPSVDHRIIK